MEINHFEPLMTTRLLESISILTAAGRIFADRCLAGLEVDRERSLLNLMRSPAISTVFVPRLGYDAVSKLVQRSVQTHRSIIDLAIEEGMMTRDEVLDVLWQSTLQEDAKP
jgi:aspartate ammonia-lyase